MFKSKPSRTYQSSVDGYWGEFDTSAGRVAFVQTLARLGSASTDSERRLTSQLRPVREVLPVEKMDFNQLLQRDLDDFRVAEDLIPYLLKPKATGPAFFPPIMAVLLPFKENKPSPLFPEPTPEELVEDKALGVWWRESQYGDAFAFRRLTTEKGDQQPIKLGRLLWNEEHGKLVVLDGQHRAMALIAIDRTINQSWGNSTGSKYRHFYEKRVNDLLKEVGGAVNLEKVEIPVTVCWFPELRGSESDNHKAARKLFVDVNKEARTPSEARLTLLSDGELLNVLTRSLLNRLRGDSPPLPLFAIEYDNPERDVARPVRWSVLTNLNLLKFATLRTVFGPKKHIVEMEVAFGGRPPESEMDAYMRQQLDVESLFPSTVPDGERTLDRNLIGNLAFPIRHSDLLVERFLASWGAAVLNVLGGLRPYEAHWKALQTVRDGWSGDDSFGSLAYDALFGGMGLYWTLRASHEHWLEARETALREHLPEPARPDIVRAWDVLERKQAEFRAQRAVEYLGKKGDLDQERSEKFYGIANTHACQLGAILSVASLAFASKKSWSEVAEFSKTLVGAWNEALDSKRSGTESRRLVLGREDVISNPINRLGRMDTTFALFFRYFWLELLRLKVARDKLGGAIPASAVDDLASKARKYYVAHLVEERRKAIRASAPDIKPETAIKRAREKVAKEFQKALVHWFEFTQEQASATVLEALGEAAAGAGNAPAPVAQVEEVEEGGDSIEGAKDEVASVEELLKQKDEA